MARISRTGTTDSTGVASTTVTGSGGGRLKFISRNGGLWSNSCEVDDYSVIDDCTIASHNDNCWIHADATKFVRGEEYTSYVYENRNLTSFLTGITDSCIVDFDLQRLDANFSQGFLNVFEDITSLIWFSLADMGLSATTEWLPLRLTITSSSATLTLRSDPTKTITKQYTATGTPNRVRFIITNIVTGFNIRNVKVLNVFSAPKHYTPIALSSSASIIQTGETATLTAELTNVLGEKLAQKSVNFIEKFKPTNLYTNDGTDTSTLTIPSGASVTVEDGALKMTTSTIGEKTIAYNYDLNNSDNFLFECEIAKLGTSQSIAMYVRNSTTATGCWFSYENSTNKWGGGILGSTFSNVDTGTLAVGDKIKIKQLNGVITLYHNDAVIYSKTANLGSNFKIGHYTNNGRIQYIKNIKLTDWAEDTLIGTGTTNSQGIATCNNAITGTGKGERQFIASNSSIQSEIFVISDCLWYDLGTSDSHKTPLSIGNLQVDYETNGTLLTNNESGRQDFEFNYQNTGNCIIEFDAIRLNDSVPRFYTKSADYYLINARFPKNTLTHCVARFEDNSVTITANGNEWTGTTSSSNNRMVFLIASGTSFKFSNLKIYSL